MLRIALVTIALLLAVNLNHGPAEAASSEFDGRWTLDVSDGCRAIPKGKYEAVIENGVLTGQIGKKGQEESLNAKVEDDGKLRDGRLDFRRFYGRIDGTSGRGTLEYRMYCIALWTLTLVEPAQTTPIQKEKTAALPADDAPPTINAPGTVQTDGPVIELTGRVSDSSAIIEFTVNGAAASLQPDGGFYIKRGVVQGQSELVIAALDEWGNRAERRVQVTRKIVPVIQSADTGRAKATGSEFDGRWSLSVSAGSPLCYSKEGNYEAIIENGVLRAEVLRGDSNSLRKVKAKIEDDGKLRDGRMGVLKFEGNIEGTSGRGNFVRRSCFGDWTLTLVEPAQAAPVQQAAPIKKEKTVAVAADDSAPRIEAPATVQTDGPVIELTGRVSDSSQIIEFTVNGAAASLQADGGFYIKRGVAQGQSELVIAALDEWGNRAERRVRVTRSSESVTRSADAAATTSNADTTAPLIALPPSFETNDAIVEISGGIVDASAIVDVRVAGRSVALEADGTFSIRRGVAVGESELVVTALDEWGNESEKRIRVTRRAPAEESPAEAPQTATIVEEDRDTEPPSITLPQKLVTEGPEIDIAGSVADDSAIAEIFVNERPLTLRADGSFRTSQRLKVGVNKFAFTAIDEWGNKAAASIDVMRKRLDLALGDYHALVIGNNDYGDMPKLNTAVADAEAISQVLTDRYGFSVTKLINATRFDVISAMSDLRAKLSYDTNLLIYYAGHGVVDPVTERGYWLPVDAHQDISANWVSNDDITDMLKAIPARHILVIADSCYSGTLVRAAPVTFDTWEDRRDWLKRIVKKRSRTALASGGLEPVADSGGGDHSVFAAALLGVLRENSETVEAQALFAPVRKSVVLNADQTPVYSDIRLAGHDGGDFIFSPK